MCFVGVTLPGLQVDLDGDLCCPMVYVRHGVDEVYGDDKRSDSSQIYCRYPTPEQPRGGAKRVQVRLVTGSSAMVAADR